MADSSPGERDSAVFAPRSVRGPSSRPRIVAAALTIAVGGLVLIGLLQPAAGPADRRAAPASELPAQAAELPAQLGTAESATARQPSQSQAGPATTGPLLQLNVQRDGRNLFVHGEVYSRRVTVVIVSLRSDGRTADSRTVGLPGGSTAFRLGAVDRFDVQFDHPASLGSAPITIQASGYDAADDRIASVQVMADTAAR